MTALLGPPDAAVPDVERRSGRILLAGLVAAGWTAGIGLVLMSIVTVIGWAAAPHADVGHGLAGALRTAAQVWLIAHHVGFAVPGGRVGLLPLGLTVLPALLLFHAGTWLARRCAVRRPRHVLLAALAVAWPYAFVATALAKVGQTSLVRPSAVRALAFCFVAAFVFGGAGVLHAVVSWSRQLALVPERARSVLAAATGALAVLVAAGSVLAGASLGTHLDQARSLGDALAPGPMGAILLLLLQATYVPNAIVWAVSYAVGPGFAVGVGTIVAPGGVALGDLPALPLLAALPSGGSPPALSLAAVAAPLLAGIANGTITVRIGPDRGGWRTALWAFTAGAGTGLAVGVLTALSGGPLGGERLAVTGPSPWLVGLAAGLEIGLIGAGASWVVRFVRRH
ncbi:MAG: cell division protein PerM [Streptosporangiaceae bacterium]